MEAFFKLFNKINRYFCFIALAVMVILTFLNTMMRYFLSDSILVTEEICRFLFVWATFMAVVTVWYEKGHICVTIIIDRLSLNFKAIWMFVFDFLTVFSFVAIILGSIKYILINSYYAQITGISYGLMIFPILLSSFFCLLMTIDSMFRFLMNRKSAITEKAKEENK